MKKVKLSVDFNHRTGTIKPMHAVNNGPTVGVIGNMEYYKAARIPYARTHDANFCSRYGGEHIVDIYAVFPNFDADPADPASYDFPQTDLYFEQIQQAGTRVFYRLGNKIEHTLKKYHVWPPKDFYKWAVICEHIIAHYTEGWADGFHWDMEYWEIWNEPDLNLHKPLEKRECWCGTPEQFYEFYRIAATHLKNRFPHLKIGGPAMANPEQGVWMENFLKSMTEGERVPLDFFSWHIYPSVPAQMVKQAELVREMLDRFGYCDTESILNEWNYVRSWKGEGYVYSKEIMIREKGAAFVAACMSAAQDTSIDMLMYYDAQPATWNGMFDYMSQRPLKGYYPFYLFANLFEIGKQVAATSDDNEIYLTAAADETRAQILLTYYTDDDDATEKTVSLTVDRSGVYECALTDGERTMEKSTVILTAGVPYTFTLLPQSILYLEQK